MKMEEIGDQRQRRVASSNSIGRCLISFVSSSLTHLCLFMLPSFFPSFSLLSLLSLSGPLSLSIYIYEYVVEVVAFVAAVALLGVTGVGRCCKRLVGVGASAPAFVFFNIIFIWGVYVGLVRQVISPLLDVVLNAEFFMLVIGLCSILTTDPGYVTNESSHNNQLVESPVSVFEAHSEELVPSTCDIPYEFVAQENSIPLQRVRYCRHCEAYVKGFDHHCPAFGNCIGQKNHVLFIILLVGFVFTEASYVVCSSQFATQVQIMDNIGGLTRSSRNLAISTMLFSLLQVLWQGVFLSWHIYCVCFNIKTDEWGKPQVKVKQDLQIHMTREFCGM